VQTLFWKGGFDFEEVVFVDAERHDSFLTSFVDANRGLTEGRVPPESVGARVHRAASRVRGRLRPGAR
jgi:hypothetical protein